MADERRADSAKGFDFADVDITDDFMFSTVMQDASLCMERLILNLFYSSNYSTDN